MNKIKVAAIACCVFLSMPFAAAGHNHGTNGHDKAAAEGHHGGQTPDGSMIILGNSVSKGVRGMAHLKDVSATMAKMGMLSTHHIMIAFVDEATGKQFATGKVALKITNPDAKVGETIELIGMDGHFGADVVLDMQGEYHFKIGTKLADGVNRKYHFHYVVE